MQRVLEAPEFDESTGEVECGGNCDTTTGFLKKLKSGSGVSNKGFLEEGLAEVCFCKQSDEGKSCSALI